MVHETIQGTFRQTNPAEYPARREKFLTFAASTWIWTPRFVLNNRQSKQVAAVALRSAKLIQSVMS